MADVQTWLDDPTTNFGWMLIGQAEEANFTARRFASHEDTGRAPYLVIDYVPPPEVDFIAVRNGQVNLSFAAQANQTYAVEFRASLSWSNDWSTLTNFAAQPTATNLVASDPVTDRERFYRLRLP